MPEIRIKDIDEHEIDTILAEDIDFEGHLTFKKPLMIKGKFKGEIKSTSALYIGEKAYVEATTEADVVSSRGRHKGDILGRSRVELYSTARVDGDITTPDFVVESGCKFNGNCNMGGEQEKKEGQAPQAAAASGTAAQAASAGAHAGNPSPASPHASSQQAGSHAPSSPAAGPQGGNVDPHRGPSGAQPQQQKPLFSQGGGSAQAGGHQPPGGQK